MNWSTTTAVPEKMSPEKRSLLIAGLLVSSFLLYANAVMNGFVYDDHTQIERNPYVHSLKYAGQVFVTPLAAQQGKQVPKNFYRPMVNLSFLLCYALFGPSPYGFHLISILLHCVVVWLVFVVSAKLFSNERHGLIAAAFFSLHPVHTESVVWIDGISDLYFAVFGLLAFWLFLRQTEQQQSKLWIRAGMVACLALAFFSKETAMAFPILVTVYEHFYRSDRLTTSWKQKFSRYGWAWVTALVFLAVRAMVLGTLSPTPLHAEITPLHAVLTALALVGQYVAKLVWPVPLIAFYPFHESRSFFDPRVLFGLAVLLAACVGWALLWKRARLYTFALFWIFLILAPALNARFMAANVFAERYLYLPSIGFSWLVAGGVLWCWRKSQAWPRQLRWALGVASTVLALLASAEIILRNRDWKDDRTLVVRTLEVLPDSPNMRSDLGRMEWYDGNHDEAERQWHLALASKPDTVEALANLGFAKLEEKKYDEAIPYLQKAIELKPRFATPHIYLGRIYAAEGNNAAAEDEFRTAIDKYPMNPDALKALGKFYLDEGRLAEAEQQFLASVSVAPDIEAWSALGETYDRESSTEKAEDAWRHVLALDWLNPEAHHSLGRIYLLKGQMTEAREEFEACLRMDPRDPAALAALQKMRDTGGPPAASKGEKQ